MRVIRGSHVKHDAELVNLGEGYLGVVLCNDVRVAVDAAPGGPPRPGDPGQRGELAVGVPAAWEDGRRVPDELARVIERAASRGGRGGLGPAVLPFPRVDERVRLRDRVDDAVVQPVGRDGGVAVPLLRLEEMLEHDVVGRLKARHVHVVDVLAPVAVRTFVDEKERPLSSGII